MEEMGGGRAGAGRRPRDPNGSPQLRRGRGLRQRVFGDVETGAVEEGSKVVCVSPRVGGASLVSFMLRDTASGAQLTGAASFEYYEGLTVATVVPSSGVVTGGGTVTVIGSGLNADSLVCRFGETRV